MRPHAAFIVAVCVAPIALARTDVVHVVGDFSVRGVVTEKDGVVSVATTTGPRQFRREEVLFVERLSDPAKRDEVVKRATVCLHRIGDRDATREMEALAELESMAPGDVFQPLVDALHYHKPEVRRYAAFRLGLLGSFDAVDPLVEHSLRDPDEGVRTTAFSAARRLGHPKIAVPYVRSLRSKDPRVRMRSADALAEIGDTRAVKYLVQAIALPAGGAGGGGGNPSSFFFSGSEQAYVRDFDVQVAQNAVIADPDVGTLVEGGLLEAKVIGVTEEITVTEVKVLSSALSKLTGKNLGPHPDAWALWWKTEGSKSQPSTTTTPSTSR
jgi:HEAT repeat protein